jgi:Fibronectin type III domain
MKQLLIVAACLSFVACSGKGSGSSAACSAAQTNRCSCGGTTEGLQTCLPSGQAFAACVCSDACTGGADCVATPSLIGMDMDQTGDAVKAANLKLPDSADLDGGFTTIEQVADPPVHVLAQDPQPGVPVKPGTQVSLTVTLPPDQESLGLPNQHFLQGALNQDTEVSAQAYYDTIDPGPFPARATLDDWKLANGFGTGIAPDLEAQATYVSHADLGFGRIMHVRKQGKRVAFFVDNYPTMGDAVAGSNFFATVTMEWSPGPNGKDTDPYFTQFYVYNKKGDRVVDARLDDHGPKPVVAVCLACHGGTTTDLTYQSNGGNVGAHFIPFDLNNLEFSPKDGFDRTSQEAAFKTLNEAVYSTWDPNDPAYAGGDAPPVISMVDAWYGGPGHPSPTMIDGYVLPGWQGTQESRDLFTNVFGKACITCHAQREPFRNFSNFTKFVNDKSLIATRVFEEGVMPLSEKGNRNFWLSYPNQPKILANFLGIALHSPGNPVAHITVTHPGALLTAGTVVTLSGVTSNYGSAYQWTQTGGPTVQLTPAAADNSVMTFVAPAGAAVTFQLVVSLGGKSSAPDTAVVTTQGPPDAPAGVTAVAGLTNAVVTWTQPRDGGATIEHSVVTASPGNIVTTVTGAATQVTVTGLTVGQTYTFTVTTTNQLADSPVSAPSNAVTVFGTPGSPTVVSAVPGNSQVTLTWSANANTGGIPLQAYQITGNPAPTTPLRILPNTTTATITGLTNGVSYVFSVVADNGALSAAGVSLARVPDVAPLAPASVAGTDGVVAGSADVSWTAPPGNGGTSVTGYRVTAISSVDGTGPTSLVPASPLNTVVNGLNTDINYTFKVEAQNGAGFGAANISAAVFLASTPGAPSAPQSVVATFISSQTARVTWSPPATDSGTSTAVTTGYRITGSPSPTTPIVVGTTALLLDIPGLTGGVSYTFKVVAVNSQGAGPSGTSNAVAISGPPQAPVLNPLTAGAPATAGAAGTLTASWSVPNDGGSAITSYTLLVSPGAITISNIAGTSIPIGPANGLSRCTTYTVSVVAKQRRFELRVAPQRRCSRYAGGAERHARGSVDQLKLGNSF